jgi:uroporphyrinogen-III synthase
MPTSVPAEIDSPLRVLVTRPAAQAREWVDGLRAAGLDAQALPLIDIRPIDDPAELHAAWHGLADVGLVMFVSPNAAEQFFAHRPGGAAWPTALQAASPGPGTTRVLRALGVAQVVEPAADAAQFDSEALWAQLRTQAWSGRRVLVVRGTSGRDWLADRLREQGAAVTLACAYGRGAPVLDEAGRTLLQAALDRPARHVWFFSSSEAVDHLEALAPSASWTAGHALATHPRIAARARALGLGQVLESRPSLAEVVACIQSIAS